MSDDSLSAAIEDAWKDLEVSDGRWLVAEVNSVPRFFATAWPALRELSSGRLFLLPFAFSSIEFSKCKAVVLSLLPSRYQL